VTNDKCHGSFRSNCGMMGRAKFFRHQIPRTMAGNHEAPDCSHAAEVLIESTDQVRLGLAPPGYALLETTGRKTGKPCRTPVGNGRIGREFWLVAEHGMKSGYVQNIARSPRIRLKLREGLRMRWHTGTAHILSDDDPMERQRWLATQLPGSASNARAVRLFGTNLLTVRIDLDV
jgi:deazaflavin-dependent oxidoreductase (nitroreductase family)